MKYITKMMNLYWMENDNGPSYLVIGHSFSRLSNNAHCFSVNSSINTKDNQRGGGEQLQFVILAVQKLLFLVSRKFP